MEHVGETVQSAEMRHHASMLLHSESNRLAQNLLSPSLVLAVLVRALGGSDFLVGVLANLRMFSKLGWPLLISAYLLRHPHRRRILSWLQGIRGLFYLLLGVLLVVISVRYPTIMLIALFVVLIVNALLVEMGQVVRLDLLGRLFSERKQTLFFANDQLLAGVFGIFAGFFISIVLRSGATGHVPLSRYAYLLIVAAFMLFISALAILLIKEPQAPLPRTGPTLREQFRTGLNILQRNVNYRRFIMTRITLPLYHIASPFYIVYAIEVLHVPTMMVGYYTVLQIGANLLTNFLWRWIDGRWGAQWVMKSAMSITLMAPLIALTFRPLATYAHLSQPAINWGFGLLYLFFGGTMSGRIIAIQSLLLQVSRDEKTLRPTYIGFSDTVQAIFGVGAISGGIVVHYYGYDAVFGLAILFALWGTYNALRIHLPPEEATATMV